MYVEGSEKAFVAATDLVNGTIVKLDANGKIVAATAATDNFLGVINSDVKTGFATSVRLRSCAGTLHVKTSAAVAKDAAITSTAAGLAVTTTTAGNQILGYALRAVGAAGLFVEVMPTTAKY
ncbi:MAG TPA: capsid cement protein [Fibrella sp.]|jgi:hypothetical protein